MFAINSYIFRWVASKMIKIYLLFWNICYNTGSEITKLHCFLIFSLFFDIQVKTEARRKSLKRRSIRMANAKRVLIEQNTNTPTLENTMSSSDVNVVSGSTLVQSNPNNISLVSYNDFTVSVVWSSYTYTYHHPKHHSLPACFRRDSHTFFLTTTW